MILKRLRIWVYIFCLMPFGILYAQSGILIWFYTLETKPNKDHGNVLYFKQTAGVSTGKQVIHDMAPLTPQSKMTLENDNNWYLNLNSDKIIVRKDRPLFLGQVLSMDTSKTTYKRIPQKYNVPVSSLSFEDALSHYIQDRRDLGIHHPVITSKRDELLRESPRLLDYLIAVDRFVHGQFSYKKPKRPNTAVDLMFATNAWCGEYAKLKLALMRSAGIPTRDVYSAKVGTEGPAVNAKESSGVHTWLQSYLSDDLGWITIPSTRHLRKDYKFVSFRGGYYIRALDLRQYTKDIQQKRYTYNALKRSGGIRGNGMFFPISQKYFNDIVALTNEILDYHSIPETTVFDRIAKLPEVVRPLLYWFLISVPDEKIYSRASKFFSDSIHHQGKQKVSNFYRVSPQLVKERIKRFGSEV